MRALRTLLPNSNVHVYKTFWTAAKKCGEDQQLAAMTPDGGALCHGAIGEMVSPALDFLLSLTQVTHWGRVSPYQSGIKSGTSHDRPTRADATAAAEQLDHARLR